ncbi:MAG: sugar ABC transporter permease, partial [Actinobacteria bacterium]|nr:sugar ABC transporter permease [Actinomycetota bacterium]
APPPPPRVDRRPLRPRLVAAAFVAPVILLLVLVAGFPLVYNVYNSFQHVVLTEPGTQHFVGFQNYWTALTSPDFHAQFVRTLLFTVVSVAFEMVIGVMLALVMHQSFRGRGLVRAAVLVPWAVPTVVSGMLWKTMFDPTSGFVNYGLTLLHLPGGGTTWLNGIWTSWAAILIADAWKNTPFIAILLLAGLQIIPDDLYEQGRIDGAGTVRRFFYVTLPLLKPAILVALIFRTLQSFLIFDIIYVMTNGGPGAATESLGFINVSAFRVQLDFGYGGAISVILILISVLIALGYQRVMRPST